MLRTRKPFLRWRASSGAALGQLLRSGWAERHYASPQVMAELRRKLHECVHRGGWGPYPPACHVDPDVAVHGMPGHGIGRWIQRVADRIWNYRATEAKQ